MDRIAKENPNYNQRISISYIFNTLSILVCVGNFISVFLDNSCAFRVPGGSIKFFFLLLLLWKLIYHVCLLFMLLLLRPFSCTFPPLFPLTFAIFRMFFYLVNVYCVEHVRIPGFIFFQSVCEWQGKWYLYINQPNETACRLICIQRTCTRVVCQCVISGNVSWST